MRLLREIAAIQAHARNANVFATSRFIPDIIAEFKGKPCVEIRATDGDVRRYLENQMTDLPTCVRRNQSLQETIVAEVVKAADGM